VSAAVIAASAVRSTAFDPADYGPVGLWVKADQIAVPDGGQVTEWDDQSGNDRHFTVQNQAPTLRANALNGLPVVNFANAQTAGYQALRSVWGTSSGPWSIFVVARMTNTTPAGRVISGAYPEHRNWLCGWWNNEENVFYHEGFVQTNGAATTNWHLYSEASDGATVTTVLDHGNLITFNGNGVANLNGALNLSGYSLSNDSETCNCEVAEIIYYEAAVLNADHAAVCDYLIGKWGI
jgi:hypothetical protein